MIIGMSMGQETCRILGQVSLNFTLLDEKPPDGFLWSGVETNEKTADIQARSFMARKNAKLKEKQKWSNEKLHLENARKLRGIYFIDPEDKEFK